MESDNESDIGEMLDNLLANAEPTESEDNPPMKTLKELNYNFLDTRVNNESADNNRLKDDGGPSLVHEADADSSDDEDKRNFEEQRYSDCGRHLKDLLKKDAAAAPSSERAKSIARLPTSAGLNFDAAKKLPVAAKSNDCKADPIFGIKLSKPLISSAELIERMRGRTPVTISRVKRHLATANTQDDWVIAGIVINRSTTKTSQKGSQYCIWKISDLSEDTKTVSLFLFSGAYKLFWKTTTGTAVGILNPNVMESKDDVDQATLSVDNAQKIMILGHSHDMAKCKSTKKNGEPCSNIVNLSRCEYCVYHVKQEYNKASRRSDIQSNASGRGFTSSLRPKSKAPLAGIYTQGTTTNFTPVFAKRNEKMYQKDSARLALLRGDVTAVVSIANSSPKNEKPMRKACSVDLTPQQAKKDLERLNKLRGWNVEKQTSIISQAESSCLSIATKSTNCEEKRNKLSPSLGKSLNCEQKTNKLSPSLAKSLNCEQKTNKQSPSLGKSLNCEQKTDKLSPLGNSSPTLGTTKSSLNLSVPRLGAGVKGDSIDFSQPITKRHVNTVRMNSARLNAARWVKENCGSLKQSNPNKIHESKEKIQEAGAKRRREAEEADAENERVAKKAASGVNDKFKELMLAKSAHVDLVEKSQDEEQEKYFGKLELKERMEEKMLATFKVDCKAVKCIVCRYTSFSASDLCKEQKHPLRVINAIKSFFKCSDCGNRTVSLDRIPSHTCKKCGGSHWVRAAMMDEKRTDIAGAKLSIRGGEETFIGSVVQDANLNLLVPDCGTGAS